LSGFNAEQTEKLRRVLNGGGATRFNEISESVTHIVMGDIVSADLKALKCSGMRYDVSLLLVSKPSCAGFVAAPSTHFFWKELC
jgi:topoisomerase (DNA) II binding protein 1